MTAIFREKLLYNSSAAGNGEWFRLDNRYHSGGDTPRALSVYVTAGDTVTIQGAVDDGSRLDITWDPDTDIDSRDIRTLKSYTASEEDILEGNWTYIRVSKEGTTGVARVKGML